jgi:hypothetical protein
LSANGEGLGSTRLGTSLGSFDVFGDEAKVDAAELEDIVWLKGVLADSLTVDSDTDGGTLVDDNITSALLLDDGMVWGDIGVTEEGDVGALVTAKGHHRLVDHPLLPFITSEFKAEPGGF